MTGPNPTERILAEIARLIEPVSPPRSVIINGIPYAPKASPQGNADLASAEAEINRLRDKLAAVDKRIHDGFEAAWVDLEASALSDLSREVTRRILVSLRARMDGRRA